MLCCLGDAGSYPGESFPNLQAYLSYIAALYLKLATPKAAGPLTPLGTLTCSSHFQGLWHFLWVLEIGQPGAQPGLIGGAKPWEPHSPWTPGQVTVCPLVPRPSLYLEAMDSNITGLPSWGMFAIPFTSLSYL